MTFDLRPLYRSPMGFWFRVDEVLKRSPVRISIYFFFFKGKEKGHGSVQQERVSLDVLDGKVGSCSVVDNSVC